MLLLANDFFFLRPNFGDTYRLRHRKQTSVKQNKRKKEKREIQAMGIIKPTRVREKLYEEFKG